MIRPLNFDYYRNNYYRNRRRKPSRYIRHTYENTIANLGKYPARVEEFIYDYYFKKSMSSGEIIEMLERDSGHRFSRSTIASWIKRIGKLARSFRQRRKLAIKKGRIDYDLVASKIDYDKRVINYRGN